jgi:hypothetical protein
LVRGKWDQSVARVDGAAGFECRFTSDTWQQIADLIEPFVIGADGSQWLAESPGEVPILLSVRGEW